MSGTSIHPALDIVVCLRAEQLLAFGSEFDVGRGIGQDLDWGALDARLYLHILGDDAGIAAPKLSGLGDARLYRNETILGAMGEIQARRQGEPRDLLFVCGLTAPTAEIIHRLQAAVRLDALTGVAVPRLTSPRGERAWTLSGLNRSRRQFAVEHFRRMPASFIVPEAFEPVFLIRSDVAGAIAWPSEEAGPYLSIRLYLAELRRAGFMTLVDNNARTAALGHPDALQFDFVSEEMASLLVRYPCVKAADERLHWGENPRFEQLCTGVEGRARHRTSTLYDARNMEAKFNGTAVSILAFLQGLEEMGGDRDATVVVQRPALDHHDLETRFAHTRFITEVGEERFDACVRLSQVWTVDLWWELHNWARAVSCAMLDCIGIDTVYLSDESHVKAFGFGAQWADGTLYLSKQSQDLFEARFPTSSDMLKFVYHQSMTPEEYEMPTASLVQRRTIFVVGNELRHKDVASTAELLADAFPFEELTCLGDHHIGRSSVRQVDSGALPPDAIATLYKEAQIVVYPSFYEGFGLPILEGLGNGATVIARWSPLLDELADRLPPKGQRLVAFRTPEELVAAVDAVLTGRPLPLMRTGHALARGAQSLTRIAVARNITRFARQLAERSDGSLWRSRERLFRQLRDH